MLRHRSSLYNEAKEDEDLNKYISNKDYHSYLCKNQKWHKDCIIFQCEALQAGANCFPQGIKGGD